MKHCTDAWIKGFPCTSWERENLHFSVSLVKKVDSNDHQTNLWTSCHGVASPSTSAAQTLSHGVTFLSISAAQTPSTATLFNLYAGTKFVGTRKQLANVHGVTKLSKFFKEALRRPK